MTEQNTTTLARAIIAIKAGDMAAGQELLEELLQREPDNVSGWLWLSAAVRSDEERRHCLEQVLRIHPNHPQALRGLEKLSPPSPVSGLPSFSLPADLHQPYWHCRRHKPRFKNDSLALFRTGPVYKT